MRVKVAMVADRRPLIAYFFRHRPIHIDRAFAIERTGIGKKCKGIGKFFEQGEGVLVNRAVWIVDGDQYRFLRIRAFPLPTTDEIPV